MATFKIDVSDVDETGRHSITVSKKGTLKWSPIHIDQLNSEHPAWPILCRLYGASEADPDGQLLVETDEGTGQLAVLPGVIANLPHEDAQALSLPGPLPLALDLRTDGMIFDNDFVVRHRFVGGGGIAARPSLSGAFAVHEGRRYRIPEPVFGLLQAASRLREPIADEATRMEAVAALKAAFPADLELSDGYLRDLRLIYAASTSLELKPSGDSIDIAPVLFGRGMADAVPDGELVNEDEFALLTPAEHRRFADHGFVRSPDARPVYSLGEGSFVYIDPALRKILGVIRTMQQADGETRRRFALDPRKALREECGITDDGLLDSLFIETEQFSARVLGLDVWRKPVLPWIKPRPNSWLPEKLGLKIGEVSVEVAPAQAIELAQKLEEALASGQESVLFDGIEIPATSQALESVHALTRVVEAAREAGSPETSETALEAPVPDLKMFLTVRDNLDEVSMTLTPAEMPGPLAAPVLPNALRTSLKQHQKEGYAWLTELVARRIPGGILADDMGLGKTLQALTLLVARWEQGVGGQCERKPSLIVAPTGLLSNWRDEIEQHLEPGAFGDIETAYGAGLRLIRNTSGTGRDTAVGRSTLDVSRWRDSGLVLTTYETLRDYHLSFARLPFACIVFDEVQKAKNPASQITRAVKTLNAELKLAMTGTPVENRLQDIWSITDVVWAGRLGSSQQFARDYPETDGDRIRDLNRQLTERNASAPPFMLRRLKKDRLAGLPTKTSQPRHVEMPPAQAAAYRDTIMRAVAAEEPRSPGMMLATLQALRQISLHPERPEHASGDLVAWARKSARLSAMLDVLDAVKAANEKALIFVEDLDMQAVVSALVAGRYDLKRRPDRINGSVPGQNRQAIVRRFQEQGYGFDVLILSPKAGGVGLTITSANHVIHLSRWWNPAVEDQATDRVYRIGQTRPVTVHLPLAVHPDPSITSASFDLRLDALLSRKRRLSEDLLMPVEGSEQELSDLFGDVLRAATGEGAASEDKVEVREQQGSPEIAQQAPVAESDPKLDLSERKSRVQQNAMHWTVGPGEQRRYAEYFDQFRGVRIVRLSITDPYCMTPANRPRLAAFVAEVRKVADSVDELHVTAWSPTARSMRDTSSESPASARSALAAELTRSMQAPPQLNVRFVEDTRTYRGDFHDRDIYFDADRNGAKVVWYMNLSGGIERLVESSRKCDILLRQLGR